jgi:2-C-methyl-D-erythritol 4-phosphate cytidylyltransferase
VEALGAVVEAECGRLPFALVHGESLVGAAAWALGEAGVSLVDLSTEWVTLAESGQPFVLHDALCPLTPPAFLAACVAHADRSAAVTVGVRTVTDTVKELDDGRVGRTVDRSTLAQVVSPVVLPSSVVAAFDGVPSLDFVALVTALAERFPVEALDAPAEARRVADEADLAVLEALTVR